MPRKSKGSHAPNQVGGLVDFTSSFRGDHTGSVPGGELEEVGEDVAASPLLQLSRHVGVPLELFRLPGKEHLL